VTETLFGSISTIRGMAEKKTEKIRYTDAMIIAATSLKKQENITVIATNGNIENTSINCLIMSWSG
jgi:hypothetical protein